MVEWSRCGARRKWLDAKKGRGGGFFARPILLPFLPPSRYVFATLLHVRPLSSSSVSALIPAKRRSWRFVGENNCVVTLDSRVRFSFGKMETLRNLDETILSTLYTTPSTSRPSRNISSRIYVATNSYERFSFRSKWAHLRMVSRLLINKTAINRVSR